MPHMTPTRSPWVAAAAATLVAAGTFASLRGLCNGTRFRYVFT